jgi:hypothetical protein
VIAESEARFTKVTGYSPIPAYVSAMAFALIVRAESDTKTLDKVVERLALRLKEGNGTDG